MRRDDLTGAGEQQSLGKYVLRTVDVRVVLVTTGEAAERLVIAVACLGVITPTALLAGETGVCEYGRDC